MEGEYFMLRMKPNRIRLILILVSIPMGVLFMHQYGSVAEADTSSPVEFTVPTRTPTPNPNPPQPEPTQSSGGGGGGGSSNPSQPVSTTEPAAEPTAEPQQNPAVTLAPTPENGFIVPEECGIPYYTAEFGETNVRQSPDQSSTIIGTLVFFETRPIVARYGNGPWWRILLASGEQGWVSDEVGKIDGVLTSVPIVDKNGIVMTNPTWLPTPNPRCAGLVVQPIASPQSPQSNQTAPPPNAEPPAQEVTEQQGETEATAPPPTQEVVAAAEADPDDVPNEATVVESVTETAATVAESSDTGQSAEGERTGQTAESEGTEIASISETGNDSIASATNGTSIEPANNSDSLGLSSALDNQPTTGSRSILWIIIAGVGLIFAGGVSMIIQRRQIE